MRRRSVRQHSRSGWQSPFGVLRLVTLMGATLLAGGAAAQTPTPGQNINMVSGKEWPTGDPFLQRQNEPSVAVSSRNPRHLLAGANDYRTVDIRTTDPITATQPGGDVWLGVFKSLDGGQTWMSTLLPGYPQDRSQAGMNSPLFKAGMKAAADPTVRAGTHGMFYYSGIAFNRDTNLGVLFVARYLDLNNKEDGTLERVPGAHPTEIRNTTAIQYLDLTIVDSGTSGQFLDKPWIAVDSPRGDLPDCVINASVPDPNNPENNIAVTQRVPAGRIHLVWSRFTGARSTKIMVATSTDCGVSWSKAVQISQSNNINQGTVLAVDPAVPGRVFAAWRRFGTPDRPDAIVAAVSTDHARRWSKTVDVVAMKTGENLFYDQKMAGTAFRTNALPTMAVSARRNASGQLVDSYVHLAWAQRLAPGGDSRIVVRSSSDGLNWGGAVAATEVVDGAPILDERDLIGPGSFSQGHQFKPALAFAAGKLTLLYYDSRVTRTLARYYPVDAFPEPDPVTGRFLDIDRYYPGALGSAPHRPFVDDELVAFQWQTLDVRVAQAEAGPVAPGAFVAAHVSSYPLGPPTATSIEYLDQLQHNPPNLPLFQGGTVPFIGDYIDVNGEVFLPPAEGESLCRTRADCEKWWNVAPSKASAFHAVWTDNRDVKEPPTADGWTQYAPPVAGQSIFLQGETRPACEVNAGMRNQNIYTSRITQGILVSAPQNFKPLNTAFERTFPILIQNFTNQTRTFRLTIGALPAGVQASFTQGSGDSATPAQVTAAAGSGVALNLYAKLTDASASPLSRIRVEVEEVTDSDPFATFVLLNPDSTMPRLITPHSNADANPDVLENEIYNISVRQISVRQISVRQISVRQISVRQISVRQISVRQDAVSDVVYELANDGNTGTTYTVQQIGALVGLQIGDLAQLLVVLHYNTLTADGCTSTTQTEDIVLLDVDLGDPELENFSFTIPPGGTVSIIVRLYGLTDDQAKEATDNFFLAAVSESSNTDGSGSPVAVPLRLTTTSLPEGTQGAAYSTGVNTSWYVLGTGGQVVVNRPGELEWSVTGLPAGLGFTPQPATQSLLISGTPAVDGEFTVTVTVNAPGEVPAGADASVAALYTHTRTYTLVIHAAPVFQFLGFESPLAAAGTPEAPSFSGTHTLGRAIPLKWKLMSGGELLMDLGAVLAIEARPGGACAPPAGATAPVNIYAPATGATGNSSFRLDAATGTYQLNWDTEQVRSFGPGCWTVVVTLNDSAMSQHATTVQLR